MKRIIPILSLALLAGSASCAAPSDSYEESGFDAPDAGLEDKSSPSVRYEAEQFSSQSGCAVARNNAGFTGTGFMDFGGNGTWMEWNAIRANVAGEHELNLRYANGSSSNRPAKILVNGREVSTLSFAATGRWTTWQNLTLKTSLRAGNNTVRVLASTSAGGPNVDHMLVTSLAPVSAGPVITASRENASRGEGAAQAFDGRNDTKWLASSKTAWLQIDFITPRPVGHYSITSANDVPARDPRDFRLLGSNDGSSWTTLDTRSGVSFSARFQTKTFNATAPGTYRFYRLDIQSNASPTSTNTLQLAELRLLAGSGVEDGGGSSGGGGTGGGSSGGGSSGGDEDADLALDRASATRLRIGSWNAFRGSIFPKTDSVWRAINNSGSYHVSRTEGAARVLRAVDADIWLLQETVYTSSGLPSGVTKSDIDRAIANYMRSVTGDAWQVDCNTRGLCALFRGNITVDGSWAKGTRVQAHRVILRDHGNQKLLLINVHYMNTGHATDTKSLVDQLGSSAAATFVAGDFNDGPGGARYNTLAGISGMSALSMPHWFDAKATHIASSVTRPRTNTKGYVRFGGGKVTGLSGGHIDHFFFKSSTWRAGNRFVLNTTLLSPATLRYYDMEPLDIALVPNRYETYFRDFLNNGVIYEVPDSVYDGPEGHFKGQGNTRGMDHDHLPMIVDFAW